MTSKPQMPGCSGTRFNDAIYTILATFPSRKITVITHFFDKIM
jgi:hypothetical protein